MNRIVITGPAFAADEERRIVRFLDEGALFVHIRKPEADEGAVRALVEAVPAQYRQRLAIHDFLHLACEYGLGGVHLNSRNSTVPAGFRGRVSRSCHTVGELRADTTSDYMFLSPVFDSISKPGYKAAFSCSELGDALADSNLAARTYALGGVAPARYAEVERFGFAGVALLGAAWNPVDRDRFRLQLITPDDIDTAAAAVRGALEGGCRWVQLRHKDAATAQIIESARSVREVCTRFGATFLLDDRVDLVAATGADGVHLGKNDMPVRQARRILGAGYIIGATANTFADIECAAEAGADYIGLGPLRFTTTKKNLSPVLGYDGYAAITAECRRRGIDLPIVAIGGITTADIAPLAGAGVQGVAVSGSIARAQSPAKASEEFLTELLKDSL